MGMLWGFLLMFKFDNGKFGILLFGDPHVHDNYKDAAYFRDMQKLANAALDEFKPDLCVLLGDTLSSSLCRDNPEAFVQGLRDICEPFFRRNVPVAAIMGNHEHDAGVDRQLIECYGKVEGLIMRNDAPELGDKADYTEFIYSSDGTTPKAVLWFIDSNNLYPDENISKYDCVHTDQIEWFENKSAEFRKLNSGIPMPAYIFQHIPVYEEYDLLQKPKLWQLPVSVKGHNTREKCRYVGKKDVEGYVGEGPCAPDINNGQFESWKKVGGVVAAFFGHDHLNDFSGYVDGIFLAQHKTSGFGCYTDGCRSCVRYVEISEDHPDTFTHKLKHFKEFGLECESLGPVFKRVTDRQSFYLNIGTRVLGAAVAAGTASAAVHRYLKHSEGTNGKEQ